MPHQGCISGPYHCEKVCMSLRLYRLLLAFGFVLVSRPDAAFRQRAATAQLRTRHRSISRTRSIWYSRRGCAKKSGRRLIGSRCAAFSRRGTTRIMRCDHDYGYEWLLLTSGQDYLGITCLSAALGARGGQRASAEAP